MKATFEDIQDMHNLYLDTAFEGIVKAICLDLNTEECNLSVEEIRTYMQHRLELELDAFFKEWGGKY
jgi:hypothetical protein